MGKIVRLIAVELKSSMNQNKDRVYKVRFFENNEKDSLEVLVRSVEPSEFPGLVCFSGFIHKKNPNKIIVPSEEEASRRFQDTKSIHVPYHNILFIEEIEERQAELKNLPFIKGVPSTKSQDPSPMQ